MWSLWLLECSDEEAESDEAEKEEAGREEQPSVTFDLQCQVSLVVHGYLLSVLAWGS